MHVHVKQQQREKVLGACKARGIEVVQRGQAFVLIGAGVDIQTSDLAAVDLRELQSWWTGERQR